MEAAIDRRRIEKGLRWRDLLEAAQVAHETMRRLRVHGLAANTDVITLRRIDRALGWEPGTIEKIGRRERDGGGESPSDDRPDYVAPDAERIDAGDGLVLWEEIAREVAPDVERAAAGMSQEEAAALGARVRENVIRQAKLFLEMEEERERQERERGAQRKKSS